MITAMPSIAALNSSCPMPANSCESAPAKAATRPAPDPPRDPPAADPAIAVWNGTGYRKYDADNQAGFEYLAEHDDEGGQHSAHLLDGEGAARLVVEVVIEFVAAGLQRPHVDDTFAARGDHFFDPQGSALKLHGLGVEVLDPERDRLVGGRAYLARLGLTPCGGQRYFRSLVRPGGRQ